MTDLRAIQLAANAISPEFAADIARMVAVCEAAQTWSRNAQKGYGPSESNLRAAVRALEQS